jgi:uncharacterized protein
MMFPQLIRDFVLAGHGDLDKVQAMLDEHPELLNAAHEWKPNDTETALQAAAHVGNAAIAEFLLARGAPLDICTAAMLGRRGDVQRFLAADPSSVGATGAHAIPLLAHAAYSGNTDLIGFLFQRGASAGVSYALHNAVLKGHEAVIRWLLEHAHPDLTWTNFRGKTALAVAEERRQEGIVRLLRDHGATA